ncbi:TPA: hypothetical protein ACH3X1_000563 [Trebouxia sp. C0004]
MAHARAWLLLLLHAACTPALALQSDQAQPLSSAQRSGSDSLGACDSDDYKGPSVAAILGWATKASIQHKHFHDYSNTAVRGVIAEHDIPPKTVVVNMPRNLALSIVMGQKSPFPSLVHQDVWQSCGENVKLALVLLREAKRGQDSPWQLWIESLPHEVATLMHWSDKELQQLQLDSTPTEKDFYDQIKQQLADITDDYGRLQSTPLVHDLDISLQDLVWASDMVTSRSFVYPKQEVWWSPLAVGTAVVVAGLAFKAPFINKWQYSSQVSAGCRYAFTACMAAAFFQNKYSTEGSHEVALLPVIDLLNHNSTSQGELQASRFSSSLRAISGPHGFVAGQEVTHSYGDKSNEMLLQFYGFVEMENIHDIYMADMYEWTKQRDNVSEERWHFLESDPLVMQALHQAELKKSGWSDAVMESLRYLFASEQEIEEGSALDPLQWFQALIKYREIPNVMTAWKQELSEKTEQRVFQVLHGFCSHIIALKPTTLEADKKQLEQLGAGTASNDKSRLALQYRITKKELLQSCVWQYDPSQMAP